MPPFCSSEGTRPMPLLSVAIVTLNEELNLKRTLESVCWANEIVIVDSGSTDATLDIARSYGARIFERAWPGYAAQKNFAINQCTGDWILSLDADEELSPELQAQVHTLLPTKPPFDAFFLKRRNLFLGRWIRHGGFYPDKKLRLFRRSTANFDHAPQFEDRPVHETIEFHGVAETLDYDIIHHAYPTLSHYIEHMDRYSNLGAEIMASKGFEGRSLPAFVLNVLVYPHVSFFWNYVCKLGFLDGREGLLLHLYHATYTSWKFAKAWEIVHKIAPSLRSSQSLSNGKSSEAA